MKKNCRAFILFFLFTLSPFFIDVVFSQPPPPGGPGNPPCWPPPCSVPLNGGIVLLIALGVIYGGKKIYDNSKKTSEL
ncbi:MAG: hypothetical protein ABI199_07305 [Bacteroidia bacterium]